MACRLKIKQKQFALKFLFLCIALEKLVKLYLSDLEQKFLKNIL